MQKITSKLSTASALGLAALAMATAPVLSGLPQASPEVPFKAAVHGFAAAPTPTDDPEVVEIVVALQGEGTHLGKFDELLVHYLNLSTGAFTGHTEWTVANGDTFTTVFHGQIYPTGDPAWVTFDVTHTIVGGTGRFNGVTGTFDGVNGRFNLVTGEDQAGYIGTISY